MKNFQSNSCTNQDIPGMNFCKIDIKSVRKEKSYLQTKVQLDGKVVHRVRKLERRNFIVSQQK